MFCKVVRWAFLPLFFFTACQLYPEKKKNPKEELREIHYEIERLEELQRGYEAKALRHENLANRLQFRSGQYLLAKQHWEIAEQNRLMAKKIQQQIDQLEKRKQYLLQYGSNSSS